MTSETHGEAQLSEVRHIVPRIGPRQYVIIGVILTIITAIELWISYSPLGDLIIPLLIVLSAAKFIAVVAFFMHLRFDHQLLTRFFVFGFALAAAILFALIALFWTDATDAREPGAAHVAADAKAEPKAGADAKAGAAPKAGAAVSVKVTVKEFEVAAPAEVAAGAVKFDLDNAGAVPHNLRVIKSTQAPNALPVAAGAADESKLQVVAKTADINGGAKTSVTARLEPGQYLLICNVPGHYQLGMTTRITVK
ncbi:MAG: cytochrome C oxidase subunit IV family protein [Candidatus Rokubacteria bacterium]|nr:cytochrome C oxidase subunit IV family protein [Candidatus Rokubacteria bacterium]